MVVLLGIWALVQALGRRASCRRRSMRTRFMQLALTPVILAAFYSRRANAAGAATAIAAGTFITVFWDDTACRARARTGVGGGIGFCDLPCPGCGAAGCVVKRGDEAPAPEQIAASWRGGGDSG